LKSKNTHTSRHKYFCLKSKNTKIHQQTQVFLLVKAKIHNKQAAKQRQVGAYFKAGQPYSYCFIPPVKLFSYSQANWP